MTACAGTNLVCICRFFFVKYLSGKTFDDKKSKTRDIGGSRGRVAGVTHPFGWIFLILISVFLSDHLHVQKVSKVNSLLLSYCIHTVIYDATI